MVTKRVMANSTKKRVKKQNKIKMLEIGSPYKIKTTQKEVSVAYNVWLFSD